MAPTFKKVALDEDVDHALNSARHSDVAIVSPADGQFLCYKGSTSKWENFDPNVTIVGDSYGLAKEAGGNLATIAGKDFATQTTLGLIKAKTDNIDLAHSLLAKETTLGTVHGHVDSIDGKITACNTGAVAQATRANLRGMPEREDTVFLYFSNAFGSAADYQLLAAGGAGVKHKVYSYGLYASADIEVCIRDGTSSTIKVGVRAKTGHTVQSLIHPFCGTANTILNLRAEGAVTVKGWIQYKSEA